jgi:hypothetical protein
MVGLRGSGVHVAFPPARNEQAPSRRSQRHSHGFTSKGETLRAIQVRGDSRSHGSGFGKLWTVKKMLDVRRTTELFEPNDPNYNPMDRAMTRIHCNVRR